jgi:hypothetical protein
VVGLLDHDGGAMPLGWLMLGVTLLSAGALGFAASRVRPGR